MKKPTKIILLIFALLTVLTVIAAVIMLNAVSGSALLYMNSTVGKIYAVSYRWVFVAAVIFVLCWIFIAVKKRKALSEILLKHKQKAGPITNINAQLTKAPKPAASALFCTQCGKQISVANKFCPFCGQLIADKAESNTKNSQQE